MPPWRMNQFLKCTWKGEERGERMYSSVLGRSLISSLTHSWKTQTRTAVWAAHCWLYIDQFYQSFKTSKCPLKLSVSQFEEHFLWQVSQMKFLWGICLSGQRLGCSCLICLNEIKRLTDEYLGSCDHQTAVSVCRASTEQKPLPSCDVRMKQHILYLVMCHTWSAGLLNMFAVGKTA